MLMAAFKFGASRAPSRHGDIAAQSNGESTATTNNTYSTICSTSLEFANALSVSYQEGPERKMHPARAADRL